MNFPTIPLVLLGLLLWPSSSQAQQVRKPNVILIVTDDQGSVDLNCYGAKDLHTPHIDALAQRGVRFTQFYAAAPVCSPSRAALLTGKYPQRAGLAGNASSQPGGHGMPGEQVTMAEVLKGAGYATGHVGKWHLGYTADETPNAQGFDSSFGHMGGCIDNYSHFFYWQGPNRHDLWRDGKEVWHDGEHFGDLMVRECNRFVEANKARPFFLYWAINLPHYPLQGNAKWREKYKHLDAPRAAYAAAVSTADDMIGQVMATVDRLGIGRDTIVVFMSDHGHSTEERTFGGGGSAGRYRGAKFSLFEGGIRVPAIMSWPGTVPEGRVREQMATGCDWLPTIADLARLDQRDSDAAPLDGRSLADVIRTPDAPSPHRVFHWATGKDQWAVREGDWKLLGRPFGPGTKGGGAAGDDTPFLVNLREDIGETKNVARRHPDVVRRLQQLHDDWARRIPRE